MPKATMKKMRFSILTIFPRILDSYLQESLLKKAQSNKLIEINAINIRDFSDTPHNQVDDRPFGGGPGMVLKVDPIFDALKSIEKKAPKKEKRRIILLSTRGKKFSQVEAQRLARYDHLVFICGRYEGVDERVAEHLADEELSLGPFVLSGGELPALVVMEAVSRLHKGFMHTYESLEDVKGSYPVYTRPERFTRKGMKRAWAVPKELLSGDHARIAAWRAQFGTHE